MSIQTNPPIPDPMGGSRSTGIRIPSRLQIALFILSFVVNFSVCFFPTFYMLNNPHGARTNNGAPGYLLLPLYTFFFAIVLLLSTILRFRKITNGKQRCIIALWVGYMTGVIAAVLCQAFWIPGFIYMD